MNSPHLPRYFNVSGPCVPGEHYMLPAAERLPEARRLAEAKQYFVIHAARQSGKTTLIQTLADDINADGRFHALYCSLEALQGVEDMAVGMESAVTALRLSLGVSPAEALRRQKDSLGDLTGYGSTAIVTLALSNLCRTLDKPLALFFD